MKHISYAFARSPPEMCLISGSWSLEDILFWCCSVCVQEKGQLPTESNAHVRSLLLQFSACHWLPGKVQTKSENRRSDVAVACFIRFVWKYQEDYELLAFLRQCRNPRSFPEPSDLLLCPGYNQSIKTVFNLSNMTTWLPVWKTEGDANIVSTSWRVKLSSLLVDLCSSIHLWWQPVGSDRRSRRPLPHTAAPRNAPGLMFHPIFPSDL